MAKRNKHDMPVLFQNGRKGLEVAKETLATLTTLTTHIFSLPLSIAPTQEANFPFGEHQRHCM